jgi:hypothetical protein
VPGAGDHESNRGDIQAGRIIRVGVAKFHGDQLVPFEIQDTPVELLGDDQRVPDLAWK